MIQKLAFLTLATFVFSIGIYAQGDSDWISKKFDVDDFTKIQLEGGYKVFLAQGDENTITVKTNDDDVFDDLIVSSERNRLLIKMDREYFKYERINLYITFKDLEQLNIEGGVNLKTKGYLDLNDFSLHVEGGAKIELDVKADKLEVVGEGGFLFELDGIAKTLDIKISGAGHIDADELKARDVTFKVEGFGTGSVYATNTLYVKIDGVGKVRYKGDPDVTKSIDGLGSVKRD